MTDETLQEVRRPRTPLPDDLDALDFDGADDEIDLDGLNVQIADWLAQKQGQEWSDNAFHDFVERLLTSGARPTNRDVLVAGVLKAWPDSGLKGRTLDGVWRDAEAALFGSPGRESISDTDRLAELGIHDPAPYAGRVIGEELADEITSVLREYVTAAPHFYPVMALWVLHSHCIKHDWLDCSPRLVFKSPTKGCGKSTTMRVLRAMCPRAMMTTSMTGAAMFRITEEVEPTLFVDELDSNNVLQDIGFLVKSGYKKGEAVVIRCAKTADGNDELIPTAYNVFSAVALAGIGNLLDAALQSRSLEVMLHGRTADEARTSRRFKSADQNKLRATIMSKALRWAADSESSLVAVGPMPDHDVVNRDLDLWEPLWTIAQVLGGHWPHTLKASLDTLTQAKEDPRNRRGDILLDVIRLAHSEAEYRTEQGEPTQWTDLKFTAAELWRGLIGIDNGKWAEGQNGSKGLTVHQMERALSPFAPPDKQDGLSRRTDKADTFRHIERSGSTQRTPRAQTGSSRKRSRVRAIWTADLVYACERYVKAADITDT